MCSVVCLPWLAGDPPKVVLVACEHHLLSTLRARVKSTNPGTNRFTAFEFKVSYSDAGAMHSASPGYDERLQLSRSDWTGKAGMG